MRTYTYIYTYLRRCLEQSSRGLIEEILNAHSNILYESNRLTQQIEGPNEVTLDANARKKHEFNHMHIRLHIHIHTYIQTYIQTYLLETATA